MPEDSEKSEAQMLSTSVDRLALNERREFEIAATVKRMLSPEFLPKRLAGVESYEQSHWRDRMPLIAAILAALEKFKGRQIDAKTVKDLISKKPFQNLDIIEYGFGSSRQEHISALHALGANVFGVEPNKSNVQSMREAMSNMAASDQVPFDTSKIQIGFASQIPTLFPGQKFDVMASSRTMESYPISEDFAVDILNKTRKSLKPGGLSIHTTTDPFIPESRDQIEKLGYEAVVLNADFERRDLAGVHKYTILIKKED